MKMYILILTIKQLKYAEDPNDFTLPSIISATAKVMSNDGTSFLLL